MADAVKLIVPLLAVNGPLNQPVPLKPLVSTQDDVPVAVMLISPLILVLGAVIYTVELPLLLMALTVMDLFAKIALLICTP